MKVVDFVNLTTGLSWLGRADGPQDFRLVRIQSTACEQKRWDFLLEDLSYEFLVHAAMGDTCRVWDASARKDVSRAIYQGLPWIRYAAERRWLGKTAPAYVRGKRVDDYFDRGYRLLGDRSKRKLDYAGRFLATDEVRIEGRCEQNSMDGRYEELVARVGGVTVSNQRRLVRWNPL